MKTKHFFIFVLIILTFTSCDPIPEEDQTPTTWSWTERAFSLKVFGKGTAYKTGDAFDLNLLGYGTLLGKIKIDKINDVRVSMRIRPPGIINMTFILPGGEQFKGTDNGGTMIIDEDKIPFPEDDKDLTAAVPPDGMLTSVVLPVSVGVDEVGGKTYNVGTDFTCTFNAGNNTYTLRNNRAWDIIQYETGTYSWDNEQKMFFLLPEKYGEAENNLKTRDAVIPFFIEWVYDVWIPATGMEIPDENLLNEIILHAVNLLFNLQIFSYEVTDGSITFLSRHFAATLEHNETEKLIGGCAYSEMGVNTLSGYKWYNLVSTNFDETLAQLVTFLDSEHESIFIPVNDFGNFGDIILEEDITYKQYRIYQKCQDFWEGKMWPRFYIGDYYKPAGL